MAELEFYQTTEFIVAASGAIVGGLFVLAGMFLEHLFIKRDSERKEREHLVGLLQALHDEIETLWETYMESVGSQVENLSVEQGFHFYWPLSQDYFTVYSANAFFISKIKDPELRKKIVTTYTKARGLIDTFRMNNDLLQKFEYSEEIARVTMNPAYFTIVEARRLGLIEYGAAIKNSHENLKRMIEELLPRLRKEGLVS